mmetsp:Transcript_20653/g.58795  ORF Transcript_20653/g.58795 Transcript_20653/m.58795 type:complete len:668 (-) Transcript_20653:1876-3879(-)
MDDGKHRPIRFIFLSFSLVIERIRLLVQFGQVQMGRALWKGDVFVWLCWWGIEDSVLAVVGVFSQVHKVSADALLDLHDDEHDDHGEDDNSPLLWLHRSHAEDDVVDAWDVGDGELEDGDDYDGVPKERVSLEQTWVDGAVVGETGAEGDGGGSQGQGVGGLRAHQLELGAGVLVVVLGLGPEGGTDGGGDEDDGSEGNSQEEEASDEALSDAARRLVHDTILGWLDGGDESEGDGADQVSVEHLDGRQRGLVETADDTEKHGKTLGVVDWGVDHEHLAQVVPHDTSFADGDNDGGEVIISEDHLGGFTGDVGSFLAHGHTHVGSLEGRGIVDTVSGHAAHFSLGLEGLDDADLVLRGGTGEDVVLLDGDLDLFVAHGVEFWSGDCAAMLFVDESEVGSDGEGGVFVVTGDHGDTDSGTVGFGDGVDAFWAWRVHDGAKSHDGQPRSSAPVHEFRSELLSLLDFALWKGSAEEGEHTETVRTQDGNLFGPVLRVDWLGLSEESGLGLLVAQQDHAVWGSLHVDDIDIFHSRAVVDFVGVVDGGHELVLGTEWDLGDDRDVVLHRVDLDASPVAGAEDGQLGRVSDFTLAGSVDTEGALGAEDSTGKGVAEECQFWGLARSDRGVVGFDVGGWGGIDFVLFVLGLEVVAGGFAGGVVELVALLAVVLG